MMELFIRIRNGKPYEHPILGDNFQLAFPDIDVNNLPSEYAIFERVPAPAPGVYEVVEGPTYQWVNGIVKDVWNVRPMTDAERAYKEAQLRSGIEAVIQDLRSSAQTNLNLSTTDGARQIWVEYIGKLDAFVIENLESPVFPMPPRINSDGTALTTTAPGSAPSVTG